MITAISAIFVFLMVILVHEFGHFAVAKLVGIKVNEFSIGMGPKLIQKKSGETEYTIRILPIGGYVKMEGEDEDSSDPRSFNNFPPLSRIAVVAAGAIMNFVLAIVVLTIVTFGVGTPGTVIDSTTPDSPAEFAGLLPGDRILEINNKKISNWESIVDTIGNSDPNSEIDIVVKRNGENISYTLMPTTDEGRTIIGIIPKYEKSFIVAVKGGIEKTLMIIRLMFEFFGMLFKGQVKLDHLSGPVGIIHEVGTAAKSGIYDLLLLLGFININLGFINLLPIPALDGSRIIFLIIELVRGKPMNPEKEGFIHFLGFIFLISLMLIITYRDIIKFNIFRR
ncbi:MAG: RIP metalloprotease RseP [Tissierellia bacterium]|nr:RIP metalloprotease RseP [Tissierellia bacterium]